MKNVPSWLPASKWHLCVNHMAIIQDPVDPCFMGCLVHNMQMLGQIFDVFGASKSMRKSDVNVDMLGHQLRHPHVQILTSCSTLFSYSVCSGWSSNYDLNGWIQVRVYLILMVRDSIPCDCVEHYGKVYIVRHLLCEISRQELLLNPIIASYLICDMVTTFLCLDDLF